MDPLTVIVPTYNGERYLTDALDSLGRQTTALAEVIVIDDGSSDGSPDIAAEHPVVSRVVRQANRGVAVARNRGALLANTSHVAFLDQDDLWLAHRHERLLTTLHTLVDSPVLVTSEQSFWLEADGRRLEEMGEGLHPHAALPAVQDCWAAADLAEAALREIGERTTISTRQLLQETVTMTTSYVFDREMFLAAGGCVVSSRSMDDYLALINLSRLGTVTQIDDPTVLYRIHPGATTLSTTWRWHLLSALVAERFGGMTVPLDRARDPRVVPTLTADHGFQLHQLVQFGESGRIDDLLDGLAFARLLSVGRRDFLTAEKALGRAWARGVVKRFR